MDISQQLIGCKNNNINEEENGLIKTISDIEALDSQKKKQPKDESKIQTEKEEKKNNNININERKSDNKKIKFKCIKPKVFHKNSPQKRIKNPIIKKSTIEKSENDNLDKLRPYLFQIYQVMESFNINIIESKLVNLNQINQNFEIAINELFGNIEDILFEKARKQNSLTEVNKIYEKIMFLYKEKEKIIETTRINFKNEVIFQKVDIEQNHHKKKKIILHFLRIK